MDFKPGTYNLATSYDAGPVNNNRSSFTAQDFKTAGAATNLMGSFIQGKNDINAAGFDRFTGEQRARLLVRNAESRFAAGTREAGQIARGGRKTESDAIAAMVAQGGTVDPTMIAKLNQRSTYNVLSAMFSATKDQNAMIMQAEIIRSTGRINEKVAKANAAAAIFSSAANWGFTVMQGRT